MPGPGLCTGTPLPTVAGMTDGETTENTIFTTPCIVYECHSTNLSSMNCIA